MIMGTIVVTAVGEVLDDFVGASTTEVGGTQVETSTKKGGKTHHKSEVKKMHQKLQIVIEKMAKDIIQQFTKAEPEIEAKVEEMKKTKAFTDEFCDEGIKIIQKYEINLPKLYDKLKEKDFVDYITILVKNEPQVSKMMKEIVVWMDKAPKGSVII